MAPLCPRRPTPNHKRGFDCGRSGHRPDVESATTTRTRISLSDRNDSRPLMRAAEIGLRILIVAAAAFVVLWVLARLRLVVLPVVLALCATTVLGPPAQRLADRGWPRALAAGALVGATMLAIGLLAVAIAPSIASDFDRLNIDLRSGVDEVTDWLVQGPLGLPQGDVTDGVDRMERELRANAGGIAGGALTQAIVLLEVLVGMILATVLTFFFVKDGDRIWSWCVELFPQARRDDVRDIGARSFTALSGYIRGVAFTAFVDAVLIGIALWVIGVPLVIPLALVTFVLSFIPLVGATIAGAAAALVALVSEGPFSAVLVIGVILLIQQLEGNLLYPVVVGRAVKLHPVAILLAVTVGGVLAGVVGAFLAVPVTAVVAAILSRARDNQASDEEVKVENYSGSSSTISSPDASLTPG